MPVEKPARCVCDPLLWDCDKIPAICEHYVPNGTGAHPEWCRHCDHDRLCHENEEKE